MIKLVALALAVYLVVSLAACVSRGTRKAGGTPVSEEVVDAAYSPDSPDSPVVDAQFTPVPETEEAPPCIPEESSEEKS